MKKNMPLASCICSLLLCCITCFLLINPGFHTLQAATTTQNLSLEDLNLKQQQLTSELDIIKQDLSLIKSELTLYKEDLELTKKELNTNTELLVSYYIDQLSNPDYVSIYNQDYIWYTAAENLGRLGKPAIPALIARIDTTDDYERSLVFYSLLLASQADNVKTFAGDDYITTYLDFDIASHPEQKQIALAWWEKYKSYF